MSEAKPFASLSSGLLARKGAARPAMRPQGWSHQSASLDDLGWNDMGHDDSAEGATDGHVVEHPRAHHPTGLSPVTSPVHSQQAELADRFAEDGEEYDEEYDETAEPYEPEGGSGGFNGFDFSDEEEEQGEPEFRVQFKGGKKPLDLGPGPVEAAVEEPAFVTEPTAEAEDILELEVEAKPIAQSYEPIEEAFAPGPDPAPVARPTEQVRAVVGSKGKAAFTLRLDPDRHLKLRLACAVKGRSAQQLVTDALDQLLGRMPELDHMADQARRG